MGATLSRSGRTRRAPGVRPARRPAGFTLTEILIVIGLIVVVIALAVPAFNAMTGGRSVDAAMNQLSAMLGRARMEAIGLQEPRGLLFYRDPASQRVAARLVRTGVASSPAGMNLVPLDLVANSDPMLLPVGVGMQAVDDVKTVSGTGPNATRSDDGYIGFNTTFGGAPTFTVAVGGVILFDQSGRLTSRPYGFVQWTEPEPGRKQMTEMAGFLYGKSATASGPQVITPNTTSNPNVIRSQFGFVVFDDEPFKNQGFNDADPQLSGGSYSGNEANEEKWIDSNAVPVLINRYNGTLVRGE